MQNTGMRGAPFVSSMLAHLISVSFLICALRVYLVRTLNSVSYFNTRSWNCVVNVAAWLRAEFWQGQEVFSSKTSRLALVPN